MRVCILEDWELLKIDGLSLTSEDSRDTVLLDKDAKVLIRRFFTVSSPLECLNVSFGIVRSHYTLDKKSSEFLIDDVAVASGVVRTKLLNSLMYKGYIFLKWEFFKDFAHGISYFYIAVFTVEGKFVGSRAANGGVSTPELSRLIMQMPEINWEV